VKGFINPPTRDAAKVAPLDSNDSKAAGDKNFLGELILTLARRASRVWSTRRGVLARQYTGAFGAGSALSRA
jgi:hypothetical protein